MPDQGVADIGPILPWENLHEVLLDFDGVLVVARPPGQVQTVGKPPDVRVDHEAFVLLEPSSEDHVGRLSSDAGQLQEFVHRVRNPAAELLGHHLSGADDVLGLVAVEARGLDQFFKFLLIGFGIILGRLVALEQRWCDHVDPDVRALGGKDGGHQ